MNYGAIAVLLNRGTIAREDINISNLTLNESPPEPVATPGLTHLRLLRMLDASGLSPWLLGLGCFLLLTIISVALLIFGRVPDPAMYRNSIAFTAIVSFFLLCYFSIGRGWHQDIIKFLEFDSNLAGSFDALEPGGRLVLLEMILAGACAVVNLQLNELPQSAPMTLLIGVLSFYFIQYCLIILCIDVLLRQLVCIMKVVQTIRLDLIDSDFYSTLANIMVRHVGLYIFGMCIISISYIVFTEGALGPAEMLVAMMPWYVPGLVIIILYLIPYNRFRHRMRVRKSQELNCIASALAGNMKALEHSLLKDEHPPPTKIDLLYYQNRIRSVREWPFTDRIRSLVLFGILPPLTWVIAALIEVLIEGAL